MLSSRLPQRREVSKIPSPYQGNGSMSQTPSSVAASGNHIGKLFSNSFSRPVSSSDRSNNAHSSSTNSSNHVFFPSQNGNVSFSESTHHGPSNGFYSRDVKGPRNVNSTTEPHYQQPQPIMNRVQNSTVNKVITNTRPLQCPTLPVRNRVPKEAEEEPIYSVPNPRPIVRNNIYQSASHYMQSPQQENSDLNRQNISKPLVRPKPLTKTGGIPLPKSRPNSTCLDGSSLPLIPSNSGSEVVSNFGSKIQSSFNKSASGIPRTGSAREGSSACHGEVEQRNGSDYQAINNGNEIVSKGETNVARVSPILRGIKQAASGNNSFRVGKVENSCVQNNFQRESSSNTTNSAPKTATISRKPSTAGISSYRGMLLKPVLEESKSRETNEPINSREVQTRTRQLSHSGSSSPLKIIYSNSCNDNGHGMAPESSFPPVSPNPNLSETGKQFSQNGNDLEGNKCDAINNVDSKPPFASYMTTPRSSNNNTDNHLKFKPDYKPLRVDQQSSVGDFSGLTNSCSSALNTSLTQLRRLSKNGDLRGSSLSLMSTSSSFSLVSYTIRSLVFSPNLTATLLTF